MPLSTLLQEAQSAEAVGAVVGGTLGLIIAAVVGGVVGWLASIVMKTNAQMGIIANVVIGIAGSMLGQWIATRLGLPATTLVGVLTAVGGASILIGLLKVLGRFK